MLVAALSLAVAGQLDLALVCLATSTGAVLGDLTAYGLGRVIGSRARDQAAESGPGRAALRWLEAHERSWGPGLIVMGRFVPGGTTAVGVAAGLLAFPLRRFVLLAGLGAVLWTAYGVVLALVGRAAFPGQPWVGALLAVVVALGAGAVVQAVRSRRRRRLR